MPHTNFTNIAGWSEGFGGSSTSGQTKPSQSRLWPGRLQTSPLTAGARAGTYFGTFKEPRCFTSLSSQMSHFRLPTNTSCASSATPTGLGDLQTRKSTSGFII
eukprot:1350868-Alexandrium_andersonii.AAC.1